MAKPVRKLHGPGSLKDGWNKLARDLDRAFALAGLGPNEALVLQVVREGCWALPAARMRDADGETAAAAPCRVNVSALARAVERSREPLSRAVRSLTEARILERPGEGLLAINKDYTTWLRVDPRGDVLGPLFSPEEIRYIWAAKLLTTARPVCDSNVTPPVTETSHPPIEERARGIQRVRERERVIPPLTPRGGEGGGGIRNGHTRPTPGQRFDLEVKRQREAVRARRLREAEEGATRGEA